MPKTRINCPNCRQPVVAEINQLFDAGKDPRAKQVLLSGVSNFIQCPNCGYQGNLSTPVVYHDPSKELLLTYFPPELGLPINEQERIIGPLITQVMNSLPQEKRKAYLLRPQTVLTLQGLIERILEADGITREMIQEQQKRLNLLQRLMDASDPMIDEMVKNEESVLDADFFALASRLMEAAMASGDQETARRLNDLQKKLLPMTSYGRTVQEQTQEVQTAIQSLQALGKDVTREKLLDLFVQAPTETRLSVLVRFTRPALDYEFFQVLTERIDRETGAEREKLVTLRERLLAMTRQIDQELQASVDRARQLLNSILSSENVTEATGQSLPAVDDFFVQVLNEEMEAARKEGDLTLITKLQQVTAVLEQASAPPQEMAFIEELLEAQDAQEQRGLLEKNKEEVTPEFLETLGALLAQAQSGEDKELATRLENLYRTVLRFSMEMNLAK